MKKTRVAYRNNGDQAYQAIAEILGVIDATDALAALEADLIGLEAVIRNEQPEQAMESIKAVGAVLGEVNGAGDINSKVSKSRRALKGKKADPEKAMALLNEAKDLFAAEVAWRRQAGERLAADLADYDDAIKETIGVRLQKRLTTEQAEAVAGCQSDHKDISLNF